MSERDYTMDAHYPVFEYVYLQRSDQGYGESPMAEEIERAYPHYLRLENETGIIGLSIDRHRIIRELARKEDNLP